MSALAFLVRLLGRRGVARRARGLRLQRRPAPTRGVQVIRWDLPPALDMAIGRAPTDDAPAPAPIAERHEAPRRDFPDLIEVARRQADQGSNNARPDGRHHHDAAHAARR